MIGVSYEEVFSSSFCFPYGIYNDKIIDRLKKNGIIYARAVHSDHTFNIPSNWFTFGGSCSMSDEVFPKLVKKWNKTKKTRIFDWELVGLDGDKLREEGIKCDDPKLNNKEEN